MTRNVRTGIGNILLLLAIPVAVDALYLLPLKGEKAKPWTPALHRARLMWKPLKKLTIARLLCGLLAILIAPVNVFLALPLLLAGELLSRALYFRAVHSPKMTGSF